MSAEETMREIEQLLARGAGVKIEIELPKTGADVRVVVRCATAGPVPLFDELLPWDKVGPWLPTVMSILLGDGIAL